jgi:hypothetical protein
VSRIRPAGGVAGNIWGRHANRRYDAMVRTYQEVIDDIYLLTVPGAGNMILLALPRRQNQGREVLAALASRVSAQKGFRYDWGERVRHGFDHATAVSDQARVLRDADLAPSKWTQPRHASRRGGGNVRLAAG